MIEDTLRTAIQAWQSGDHARAAALCAEIIARGEPVPADAWHLAGLVAVSQNDHATAIERLNRAVAAAPGNAIAANDLGAALRMAGRLAEAELALARATALAPDYPPAWHNLGMTLRALGKLAPAGEALERAVAMQPAPPTLMGLGLVRLAERDYARAAGAFQRAAEAAPDVPEVWFNLGLARFKAGEPSGIDALRRALALKPDWPDALDTLGVALAQAGQSDEAQAVLERAVQVAPDHPRILANLGAALIARNDPRTIPLLRRALAADAANVETRASLALALYREGHVAEARAEWEDVLRRDPAHVHARSALLMNAHYESGETAASLLAAAREFGRLHGEPPGRYARWANRRDPEKRLAIGYISPDFRDHSVARFLMPLIEAHDRTRVVLHGFANVRRRDHVTDAFRRRFDRWHDIAALPDARVAELVRADEIDILVDLAGHSADNRLTALALHPAPVQATWLGYPGTTGVPAITWRISDALADPPGTAETTETILRLKRPFLCFAAPPEAPAVTVRPDGPVVFGSCNFVRKITPETATAWARILAEVPGSRLVLKSNLMTAPAMADPIRAAFAAAGVAAERVQLFDLIDDARGHLAFYGGIDVALDTFPYNGTTTTCEALWMGVPVVTLRGERHGARVGASLLAAVGLDDLVAGDRESYRAVAVALARDPARRTALRATLRARMAASPLLDAAGFARAMEDAYRTMWRDWLAGGARPSGP